MTEGGTKTPFFVGTVDPDARHNRLRYEKALDFVGPLSGDILDCGEANQLKAMFEARHNLRISSTSGDLDIVQLEGQYDAVLAFELVEHLMNPLFFLAQVRNVLKPSGNLFLSTPINKPKFLWREDHFHEFDEYRLGMLLAKAGYRVIKKERCRFYLITGVRPIIRMLSRSGTIFLQLQASKEFSNANKAETGSN